MALTQKQSGRYLNWDGKPPKEHPASHAFVTASAATCYRPKLLCSVAVRRAAVQRLSVPYCFPNILNRRLLPL